MCGSCVDACPTAAMSFASRTLLTAEVLGEVLKDRAFYGQNGGITLSGGEPMAQPEAALELLRMAKEAGLTTAIETCGFFPERYIPALCEVVDTFLWDFKDSNDERHRANTGVSNEQILKNLHMADAYGGKIVLRCILIKGVNDEVSHYQKVKELRDSLCHCIGVDWIPYHLMGESKDCLLGRMSSFGGAEFVPQQSDIALAQSFTKV